MRTGILLAATGLLLAACALMAMARNEAAYRPRGRVEDDPPAFYSADLFKRMPPPKPGDWRAAHPEQEQSFAAYTRATAVRPTEDRHMLVVAQVGPMNEAQGKQLAVLAEFLGLFYVLPGRQGPPLGLEGVTGRDRTILGREMRQYHTGDILRKVLAPALPGNAVCLQGVTMEDLYPDPSWNYVFGEASLAGRVGIYSLVRFQPAFWGEADAEAGRRLAFLRSLKTLVHETGHMFGLHHCQTYECVINGSNSLTESDARPIHLCPVCLKKLRWNLGFDVVERYEALRAFYTKHGMTDQAAWVAKRLAQCREGKAK